MFSSVRARLTLWYTGVLALVLISFALAGYLFLSFTLNRRTDDALGEMANAFAATLADDERDSHAGEADVARGEDRNSSPDEAVMEAVSQKPVQRLSIRCVRGRAPLGCRQRCPKEREQARLDAPASGIADSGNARRGRQRSRRRTLLCHSFGRR
jgi:hypothetical protein